MSFGIKNKKCQIILFSLIFTLVIFTINKNSKFSINSLGKQSFNFRSLFSVEEVNERCKKTTNEFLEKYKGDYYNSIQKYDGLSKYQKVLKEMIENKEYSKNIKKYLPRIVMYFIFLIVDILLIIVWILFCGCCCCNKNKKSSSSVCGKCSFIIYLIFSLLVILLCVLGYFLSPCFNKSINGVVCSLYKLVFHFLDGTKDDFPSSNWKGVNGLKELLDKFQNTSLKIDSLNRQNEGVCGSDENHYCELYNNIVDKIKTENNNDFMNQLENARNEIDTISDTFKTFKDEKLDNIEKIMEKVDKYFKLCFIALFSVILLFCFLGVLALIIYFTCNCECISCLYHIVWNIEMIVIILTLLAGICFGIIGVVSKDSIQILLYAKSYENLNQEKPLLLDIDEEIKDKINICFNGDGSLKNEVFTGGATYASSINDVYKEFEEKYSEFKDKEDFTQKEDLVKDYHELEKILEQLKDLNDNLNSEDLDKIFNCNFVGSDFNILIDEINDSLAKKLSLYSLIIIIANLASVISIFFGITVINNYRGGPSTIKNNEPEERQNKSRNREVKNNMDSSSDHLRK